MIAFTVLAFSVLIWQNADLSVNIKNKSSEESSKEVVISVRNTAGSTLLFYDNNDLTGKIEYLSDGKWVEFCEVCYTHDNTSAISLQYGGVFAELQPGESWSIRVPENKIPDMADGTYRISLTYVTEDKYNKYLDLAYENLLLEEDSSAADKGNASGKTDNISDTTVEDFLAESISEVYTKTFEYISPAEIESNVE